MKQAILIKKGDEDFEGIKWVIKAVSKEDSRYALNRLEIKDHIATATDGHRLHEYTLTKPEDFPNGLYFPFKIGNIIILIADDSGIEYPKVPPELFPTAPPIGRIENVSGNKKTLGVDRAFAQIVRISPDCQSIQVDYLKDMLSTAETFDVRIFGEGQVCQFNNLSKRGLIMPMRM